MKEIMRRLESDKFYNKVWIIYFVIVMVLFVAVKMLIADSRYTNITVVDEAYYINAARSLHNSGKLLFQSQPSLVDTILYPVVLSVVYVFYSPESIMTTMRLFGTIVYASGFIPVFMLSWKILKSPMKALLVVIITLFIPETGYALHMSQEVTHFSLMMWAFYLMYLTVCCDSQELPKGKSAFYQIMLGVVLFLLSENKIFGVIIVVSYILCVIAVEYCIYQRFKHVLATGLKLIYTIAPYIILTFAASVVKGIIYVHSGLPVTEEAMLPSEYVSIGIGSLLSDFTGLISEYIKGFFYYIFYFCAAVMVLPVIIPLMGFKQFNTTEKKLFLHTMCALICTFVVVSAINYTWEGGSAVYPQRVHYRYIYYMVVPLIVLSASLVGKKLKVNPVACAVLLFLIIYTYIRRDFLDIRMLTAYDVMSLFVFRSIIHSYPGIIIAVAGALVFAAGMIYVKKVRRVPGMVYVGAAVLTIFYFASNTAHHIEKVDSESYESRDFIVIAKILENEDNVLLIANSEYDFMFFRLDVYLKNDSKYIGMRDLRVYDESAEESTVSVRLNDIVVPEFPYMKASIYPLGNIDYVVVYNGVQVINAQYVEESRASRIFNVYKIDNGVVEFAG